jgi:hypothetical protein
VNRIKGPNTWLHRPMLQNVKKALANPEPSTHDPKATCPVRVYRRPILTYSSRSITMCDARDEECRAVRE